MTILSLDTTSPRGSAALWRGHRVVDLRASDPARGFSDQLPGLLVDLLRGHGLRVGDVDVFAVAAGPGSLTGLRVGIATIQGLAFAADRPVVAISALEALAHARASLPGPRWIGAAMNAHRQEIFSALYTCTAVPSPAVSGDASVEARARDDRRDAQPWAVVLDEVEGPSVGSPAETLARWEARVGGEPLRLAAGEITGIVELASATFGDRARVEPAPLLAGIVATLGAERAARGQAVLPHAIQPLYVRRPDAEVARERAARRAGAPATPPIRS